MGMSLHHVVTQLRCGHIVSPNTTVSIMLSFSSSTNHHGSRLCNTSSTSAEGAFGSQVLLECFGYSITSPSSPHFHSVSPRNRLECDIANTFGIDSTTSSAALT